MGNSLDIFHKPSVKFTYNYRDVKPIIKSQPADELIKIEYRDVKPIIKSQPADELSKIQYRDVKPIIKSQPADELIKIECRDGELFETRQILTSKSLYFKTLCEYDSSQTTLIFTNLTCAAMKYVLYYLKTGRVQELANSQNDIIDIIYACHVVKLPTLFEFWWDILAESMNLDNFDFIWHLANTYHQDKTVHQAVKFTIRNEGRIVNWYPNSIRSLSLLQMQQLFEKAQYRMLPESIATIVCIWGDVIANIRKQEVVGFCENIAGISANYVDYLSVVVIRGISPELRKVLMENAQ